MPTGPVAQVVGGPKGVLTAQMMPPIKVTKTVRPVKLTEPKPGVYVFDMGQNIAGWARLKVSGPAGTEVVLRYGERLNQDGTLDQKEIGQHIKTGKPQTDTYILKGQGTEVWEPRFAYHGFQYVEVTGLPGKPDLGTLEARVVHTAFDQAGDVRVLQRASSTASSAIRCGRTSATSSATRPTARTARRTAGRATPTWPPRPGCTTSMRRPPTPSGSTTSRTSSGASGELPGIVPTSGWGYQWGNGPAWDSAYVLIPWYLYQYRGDTRILAEHYDRLKLYVDYLTSKAKDHIVAIGLGDWAPAKTTTPEKVTSTGVVVLAGAQSPRPMATMWPLALLVR